MLVPKFVEIHQHHAGIEVSSSAGSFFGTCHPAFANLGSRARASASRSLELATNFPGDIQNQKLLKDREIRARRSRDRSNVDTEQVREQYPANTPCATLPRSECRLIKNRWICFHKSSRRAFAYYALIRLGKSVPGWLRQTAIEYFTSTFPGRRHGA